MHFIVIVMQTRRIGRGWKRSMGKGEEEGERRGFSKVLLVNKSTLSCI